MDKAQVKNAAKLVGYALRRPIVSPAKAGPYAELVDSFQIDEDFAATVRAVVEGLGLRLLDVNSRGLFLAAQGEESAFRGKIELINTGLLSADLRHIFGLALTVIAAIFYQSHTSLSEDMAPTVSIIQVREELINIAKTRMEDVRNGDEDNSDIDEACAVILSLPITGSTDKGGQKNNTVTRWVQKAFDFLVSEGFVGERSGITGGGYTAYSRFRVHMKEFMALEAYGTVMDILKKQEHVLIEGQEVEHA